MKKNEHWKQTCVVLQREQQEAVLISGESDLWSHTWSHTHTHTHPELVITAAAPLTISQSSNRWELIQTPAGVAAFSSLSYLHLESNSSAIV